VGIPLWKISDWVFLFLKNSSNDLAHPQSHGAPFKMDSSPMVENITAPFLPFKSKALHEYYIPCLHSKKGRISVDGRATGSSLPWRISDTKIFLFAVEAYLKKMSLSVGMTKFPTEWKNKTCSKPPTSYMCCSCLFVVIDICHDGTMIKALKCVCLKDSKAV